MTSPLPSLTCCAILLSMLMTGFRSAPDLPNIVIIYTDDLGFGDLSAYNPKAAYKTPRLDRMAAEGVRFTDAHSPSTICSPSRYALLSGQQIFRSTGGGGVAFEGPGGPSYLKPGTLTLGDMLRARGYRTGIFGKWHVGLTWYDDDGKNQNSQGGLPGHLCCGFPDYLANFLGAIQRKQLNLRSFVVKNEFQNTFSE